MDLFRIRTFLFHLENWSRDVAEHDLNFAATATFRRNAAD